MANLKVCSTIHKVLINELFIYKQKKKNPNANMEELPPDHCCAKNWSESSKAMEPMGIVAQ